ncbi:MAG: hypothetical protein WA731_21110 [Pseudonocardiaceae bacterium]|nr:hypothetical protein [Pseudonocardiaceae bacterium]
MGARRRHAVAREADYLDGLVDAQLDFIGQLPMHRREELAEALAVLVMLAQDYRYCSQGWISRRELRHRIGRALAGLDALLQIPGTAATVLPQR